ncbi:uncharacterized protein LOC122880160 [Siniperca chuatsi]|uniref:uncharacterized protein LOC122880160 n=1 Tax=Siniperca chuatsi TaxID=119488 RepID=UPI001CE1BE1A|nr:uncharacterized protein LOC122880160 [Siniperca chuatsi]
MLYQEVITVPVFIWIPVSLPACLPACLASHSTLPVSNNSTTEPDPLHATCSMILVPLTVSLHTPPPTPPHGQPRSTRYHLLLTSRTSLPVQIHIASKLSQTGDRCFSFHAGTVATSPELSTADGEPHDCVAVITETCSPRPDLQETPLINPELELFVDSSATQDPATGKNLAGFAVTTLHKTILAKPLPSNYSAQVCCIQL